MIKSQMAICSTLEGPNQIKVQNQEVYGPAEDEVLIEVKAASLNFPDVLMTYGKYQFKPQLPFTVGMEGAGIVLAVGKRVAGYQKGDRILFKGKTGACSQYACIPEKDVSELPSKLSFEEGAAFSVTFLTAYISLSKRAHIQRGEVLVVLGAGGGVGQASIAVGKALGAIVIAAASSDEKLGVAQKLGADHVIKYEGGYFAEKVMSITDGIGASVILDPVGGDLLEESVRCLAWEGRLLSVGFASGSFGSVPLDKLQEKGATLLGVRAGEYGRKNPEAGKRAYEELISLTEAENLKPWIGKCWSLGEVGDALHAMETRNVTGKQIIRLGGEV